MMTRRRSLRFGRDDNGNSDQDDTETPAGTGKSSGSVPAGLTLTVPFPLSKTVTPGCAASAAGTPSLLPSQPQRQSLASRYCRKASSISLTTVQRMLNTMAENGDIDYDGRTIVTDLSLKASDETVCVGIIGSVPCGNLSLEEEAIEEIVQLPVALFGKGDLFLLHASGDSMTGAGIDDGDLVLIRKQEDAKSGDIVVAFIEGEGNTLKRYRQYGNTVFLHPENPKYRDIPLTGCRIQGIAVSVIKKLKGR